MESNSPTFVREPVKLMSLTVAKRGKEVSQHTLECSGNKLPCRSRFFTNQLNAMAAGVEHMYAYHHGESFTVNIVTVKDLQV